VKKTIVSLSLAGLLCVPFAYSQQYLEEKTSSDPRETQQKWDAIRKEYSQAMWDLRERKPQQQVIEKFDALFQKGAIIETFDDEVLETAILYQAYEVAKFLLTKGADPNGFRSDGKPLKIATKFGKDEAITILMQDGAKPLKPEEAAQLRLTFAAGTGKLNAIKTELANGAGIDSRDTLDHETALVEAAQWGHTEAVKLLLQVGAYPKQTG